MSTGSLCPGVNLYDPSCGFFVSIYFLSSHSAVIGFFFSLIFIFLAKRLLSVSQTTSQFQGAWDQRS